MCCVCVLCCVSVCVVLFECVYSIKSEEYHSSICYISLGTHKHIMLYYS